MRFKLYFYVFIIFLLTPVLLWGSLLFKDYSVKQLQREMKLANISDLREEKVVFHSFNKKSPKLGVVDNTDSTLNDSYAELLVVTQHRVLLIKDGYDDPARVNAIKREYNENVYNWHRRFNSQKDLLSFARQQIRVEQMVGQFSPDYQRLDNLINLTLVTEDAELRELNRSIKEEKRVLRYFYDSLGVSDQKYKTQKSLLTSLEQKFDLRFRAIKSNLYERIVQEWEGLLQSSHGEDIFSQSQNYKTNKDNDSDLFFRWEVPPPLLKHAEFYSNSMDGTPDFVSVSLHSQRRPFFRRFDIGDNSWVKKNLGAFYMDIRNLHVQSYVNHFKRLLLRPFKLKARVKRSLVNKDLLCKIDTSHAIGKMIRKTLSENKQAKANSEATTIAAENTEKKIEVDKKIGVDKKNKYLELYGRIDLYSIEGTHYTVIDCNGDGIVETFLVHEIGDIHWGLREIPNVVSIFNNTDPAIENIIGDLIKFDKAGDTSYYKKFKSEQVVIQKSIQDKIKAIENLTRTLYQ